MKVAILANGDTVRQYTQRQTEDIGRRYDQVWGLNQQATWKGIELDRCFIMDDLKLRMPFYSGFEFCDWLKTYQRPIITSRAYPEWPTSEDFPIKEICHYFGLPLGVSMYSTPDYMIALAIYEGATKIDMYGVDMTEMSDNLEMRCATAVWIGAALARGVLIKTFSGSFYQYYTHPGLTMEAGLYGYAGRPRFEDLVNTEYYQEWLDHARD